MGGQVVDTSQFVVISSQPDERLLQHIAGIRTRTRPDGQVVVQTMGHSRDVRLPRIQV